MKFSKLLAVLVAGVMLLSVPMAVMANGFSDAAGHWAEKDINDLNSMGIVQGSDGLIRPEDNISRAELVTILYNMLGGDNATSAEYSYSDTGLWNSYTTSDGDADVTGFSDYDSGKWYAKQLEWAVKNKIVSGYEDGTVKADNPVTRQEAVVIFKRTLGIDGDESSITANDAADVGDWAKEAVGEFMALGFLNGDDLGNVNPRKNIKRGEAFRLLRNMIGEYITESGEYSGDYGKKLVIVKGGASVLKNVKCGIILIGEGADDPELSGDKFARVKIFGNKKLKTSKATTNKVSTSTSGNRFSGGSSSSGGGSGSSSSSTVKVTLDANGGEFDDGDEYYTIKAKKGTRIYTKMPDDPTRDGYTFVGWYTTQAKADKASKSQILNIDDMKMSNTTTIYAGWEQPSLKFDKITLKDVSEEPQEDLVKGYDVTEKNEVLYFEGENLKKYVATDGGELGFWVGFEVELNDEFIDAIADDEDLRWYVGEKDELSSKDWNGYVYDLMESITDDTIEIIFDAGAEETPKYFIIELPKSNKDDELIYEINLDDLIFAVYEEEIVSEASNGLAIEAETEGVTLTDDITAANTKLAAGEITKEEDGYYVSFKLTLPELETVPVIKNGDEVIEFEDGVATVKIKLADAADAEVADIVFVADFDGEELEYKATTYTVKAGELVLKAEEPAPEEEGGSESEDDSENV